MVFNALRLMPPTILGPTLANEGKRLSRDHVERSANDSVDVIMIPILNLNCQDRPKLLLQCYE